jgi:hypothetical protein
MKDLRTTCEKAIQLWDADCDMDGVINEMRATLAQPEPEGVTDEEIDEWQSHCAYLTRSVACGGAGTGEHYWAFDVESDHVASIVRAALARWGRPAIQPIPVSERLGVGDCDADGRCWLYRPAQIPCRLVNGTLHRWVLDTPDPDGQSIHETHWLPAHALPVPTSQEVLGDDH